MQMALFDFMSMSFSQGANSEHYYYSPLDETTITYAKLLEKVSFIVLVDQYSYIPGTKEY